MRHVGTNKVNSSDKAPEMLSVTSIVGRLIGRPFLGCELCEQLVGFLQCNWYRKVSNTTLFDKCASTYRFDNVIN